MISHQYKTIFIHMRKCAGTSIIRSFDLSPKQSEWHSFNDGILSPQPYDWQMAKTKYPDYLVVATVRNPWDRFVSGWKYLRSTQHKSIVEVLRNLPKTGHDYRHLTRLQTDILFVNGNPIYDNLLRFEKLQEDYEYWCELIGKPKSKLPHLNQTAQRFGSDYHQYFDEEAREIFQEKFMNDIVKLHYEY